MAWPVRDTIVGAGIDRQVRVIHNGSTSIASDPTPRREDSTRRAFGVDPETS